MDQPRKWHILVKNRLFFLLDQSVAYDQSIVHYVVSVTNHKRQSKHDEEHTVFKQKEKSTCWELFPWPIKLDALKKELKHFLPGRKHSWDPQYLPIELMVDAKAKELYLLLVKLKDYSCCLILSEIYLQSWYPQKWKLQFVITTRVNAKLQ